MVNMNENGRKKFNAPVIKVVELDTTAIIAQSDPTTGGSIEGGGGMEED